MGTPPLQKNGRDQSQDREMRDMKQSNDDAHKEIGASVGGIRKMLWGLLLTGLAGLIGVMSYITGQVNAMRNELHQLDDHVDESITQQRGDAREGFELARGLRRDIDKNAKDVTELRKRLRMKD